LAVSTQNPVKKHNGEMEIEAAASSLHCGRFLKGHHSKSIQSNIVKQRRQGSLLRLKQLLVFLFTV